jgi:hypothetical protein
VLKLVVDATEDLAAAAARAAAASSAFFFAISSGVVAVKVPRLSGAAVAADATTRDCASTAASCWIVADASAGLLFAYAEDGDGTERLHGSASGALRTGAAGEYSVFRFLRGRFDLCGQNLVPPAPHASGSADSSALCFVARNVASGTLCVPAVRTTSRKGDPRGTSSAGFADDFTEVTGR